MKTLRRRPGKEVLAIYALVFSITMASGIINPTFSLYARSLGASLTLIGALSGVVGLTRILASVPIGMISDSLGRKNILSVGMLLFSASSFLYTVVPTPYFLFPIRVLFGLAMVSTLFLGVAYVGDVVAKHERSRAIGLYITFMALGSSVGPVIGGLVAASYGYRASYRVAAIVALAGFVVARWGLIGRSIGQRREASAADPSRPAKLRLMVKEPNLLAASLANLLQSVTVGAAIYNFFPLYAASLSINEATIGSMFAIRALSATPVGVPTGLLTTRFPSRNLMVIALALSMIMVISISYITMPIALGAVLSGHGIATGMFLASGQAFVTEQTTESNRGMAIGLYSTAGSVGSTVSPLVLGIIADSWGLAVVFRVTGILVFMGVGVLGYMGVRRSRVLVRDPEGV